MKQGMFSHACQRHAKSFANQQKTLPGNNLEHKTHDLSIHAQAIEPLVALLSIVKMDFRNGSAVLLRFPDIVFVGRPGVQGNRAC